MVDAILRACPVSNQGPGTTETFVEQELLAGVSARYRPHVRMIVLPQIKPERLGAAAGEGAIARRGLSTILEFWRRRAHSRRASRSGDISRRLQNASKSWAVHREEPAISWPQTISIIDAPGHPQRQPATSRCPQS